MGTDADPAVWDPVVAAELQELAPVAIDAIRALLALRAAGVCLTQDEAAIAGGRCVMVLGALQALDDLAVSPPARRAFSAAAHRAVLCGVAALAWPRAVGTPRERLGGRA